MFLTHVKAHEQGPYDHHDNKDHHHNHDEKPLEMHGAAGDAELAPGTCRVILRDKQLRGRFFLSLYKLGTLYYPVGL